MTCPDPEYIVLAGSHGYGTNVEGSDEDFRGFFLPSIKSLLGFVGGSDSYVSPEGSKSDVALWEIRKFFRMCVQANPNVIETLFLPEKNVLRATPFARAVLAVRDRFLSKRLAKTYLGYATGNWKRVVNRVVEARAFAQGMMPEAPEPPAGYDPKDAMHLVRLIRTGTEVLQTGKLRVHRPEDRDLFLSIRRGEKSLGWIKETFEEAQATWKDLEKASPLPEEPDEKELDGLLVRMIAEHVFDSPPGAW